MARHGRGSEGETGEQGGYPVGLTLRWNNAYAAEYKCHQLTHTPRLPAVHWPVTPIAFHGLVHLIERQNLVSAQVPSHSNRNIHRSTQTTYTVYIYGCCERHESYLLWQICSTTWPESENFTCFTFEQLFSKVNQRYQVMTIFFFIVAPCILKSKTSHSPTNALFIKLWKV
jgi:hypothetical protein